MALALFFAAVLGLTTAASGAGHLASLLAEANSLFRSGEPENLALAERHYNEVVGGAASSSSSSSLPGAAAVTRAASSNLGALLLRLGRSNEAIEAFQRALAVSPNDAPLLGNLGSAYVEAEQLEKAEETLIAALALKPDLWDAYNNLGTVYSSSGLLEDAVAVYRHVIAACPEDRAEMHSNLATALQQAGKDGEAEGAFRKALEIDPTLTEASNNFAALLHSQGRKTEAQQLTWQAVRSARAAGAPSGASATVMSNLAALLEEGGGGGSSGGGGHDDADNDGEAQTEGLGGARMDHYDQLPPNELQKSGNGDDQGYSGGGQEGGEAAATGRQRSSSSSRLPRHDAAARSRSSAASSTFSSSAQLPPHWTSLLLPGNKEVMPTDPGAAAAASRVLRNWGWLRHAGECVQNALEQLHGREGDTLLVQRLKMEYALHILLQRPFLQSASSSPSAPADEDALTVSSGLGLDLPQALALVQVARAAAKSAVNGRSRLSVSATSSSAAWRDWAKWQRHAIQLPARTTAADAAAARRAIASSQEEGKTLRPRTARSSNFGGGKKWRIVRGDYDESDSGDDGDTVKDDGGNPDHHHDPAGNDASKSRLPQSLPSSASLISVVGLDTLGSRALDSVLRLAIATISRTDLQPFIAALPLSGIELVFADRTAPPMRHRRRGRRRGAAAGQGEASGTDKSKSTAPTILDFRTDAAAIAVEVMLDDDGNSVVDRRREGSRSSSSRTNVVIATAYEVRLSPSTATNRGDNGETSLLGTAAGPQWDQRAVSDRRNAPALRDFLLQANVAGPEAEGETGSGAVRRHVLRSGGIFVTRCSHTIWAREITASSETGEPVRSLAGDSVGADGFLPSWGRRRLRLVFGAKTEQQI